MWVDIYKHTFVWPGSAQRCFVSNELPVVSYDTNIGSTAGRPSLQQRDFPSIQQMDLAFLRSHVLIFTALVARMQHKFLAFLFILPFLSVLSSFVLIPYLSYLIS
jgi:hypothetical protein